MEKPVLPVFFMCNKTYFDSFARKKMKRFITCMLIGFSTLFNAHAQGPIAVGQFQINAGTGFSNNGIPLYIGFDAGVHKDITIGVETSFRTYEHYNNGHGYYYNRNVISFIFNGNYHFNSVMKIPDNWDFYVGPSIGFNVYTYSDEYYGSNTSGLEIGAQVGGRYYFNDVFGLNLELNANNAYSGGKFGVSFRL